MELGENRSMDPVTLAVIQNGLQQVCNEMDLAFVRAAFSPVISEALDRSDGIYRRDSGELIAQGELGLPVFVGTMQFSTQAVIERVNAERIRLDEGDIFVVNDPYLGGTHLMDVKFVKPFFYRGALWCWLANTGHWPDVGGVVPGGFSANATEVEQEGLRLPPVKLFKRGELDREILSIILSNIRVADQRIGDIKAQAAALAIGEKRLTALLDRYGAAVVDGAIVELKARAAREMRAKIATIPDGIYAGEAFVDSDGVVDRPLRIAMRITKRGESLVFDMSGSSPPCRGPMNSVLATTKSSIYLAIKHVFPEVPINAGMFEPLEIIEPEGTFLYARYPRPVSGCAAEVSQRIAEAVFGALVQAIPRRLFAAPAGTSGNLSVGGFDPRRGTSYVMYVISGGGYGGSVHGDGLSNGCSTIGISKTTPIEVMEQYYPVLFEEYSLHEGSGGPGELRGGFGVNYRIRLRRGEARASMVMDHGRFGPQGALGGAAGGVNKVHIWRSGVRYDPPHRSKDQGIQIDAGDIIEVSTPGGGGFGDPIQRAASSVARDVAKGYYTCDQAREWFGVVLDVAGGVDHEATASLRAKGRVERPPAVPESFKNASVEGLEELHDSG
jgi:N-methylhydantoinase B